MKHRAANKISLVIDEIMVIFCVLNGFWLCCEEVIYGLVGSSHMPFCDAEGAASLAYRQMR